MNKNRYKHFANPIPLEPMGGIDPPAEKLTCEYVNVNGRKEHEAMLKDHKRMEELGLDPIYETIVYLKRWGGWLADEE